MSSITVGEFLRSRGVTRRDFLRFCTATTVALGLPATMTSRVAAALASLSRGLSRAATGEARANAGTARKDGVAQRGCEFWRRP